MSVAASAVDLERTLHERFGLEQFRPGQREVIEQVLQGRDVLCVMPTGGGKSLCYQLPAVLLPGLTLVVSPLIALMKDQVDALTQRGLRATLLNSTLDLAEQRARITEIEAGRFDLVYVAPERFRSPRFVEVMARVRPALLAVDEAHCISEWGHDFRPDYARIGQARRRLGSPPCIALTATATDLVRRDIADQLDLRDPAQFVTGFDRPNLAYSVIEARRDADKLAALAELLDQNPGASIIYASSRNRCEMIGEYLMRVLRKEVAVYHAGMARDERASAQERFMAGRAEIVVATNAFGMGVDKAEIRSVIHFNLPGTLEAYYQEAGRAGRDGLPAQCALLFAVSDRYLQEMFIENEYPPADMVYKVYNFLRERTEDPIELTQAELREAARIDLNDSAVGTALKILEGAGAIEKFLPRENQAIVRINVEGDEPSLVPKLGAQAHVQRVVLTGLEGLVNRRFGEPVYFQPDQLAAALGLDRAALNRALRAIVAELPVDYVPPFRGNAIRVNDRTKRPRDLDIDFTALEKRKQREYDKLERMMRYAQTTQCRRAFILGYFGDTKASRVHCGHCDNCSGSDGPETTKAEQAIDTEAGREAILKMLSGVARAKGRFGKTVIAQMLAGSESGKMDRWGLKRLSTFGILSTFRRPELVLILDALAVAGFVEYQEVDRFRPIVNLTARGWELLRGQLAHPIQLALPDELAAKLRNGGLERAKTTPAAPPRPELPVREIPSPVQAPPDEDPEATARRLFRGAKGDTEAPPSDAADAGAGTSALEADPLWAHLKTLRSAWAREAKQPPYCIFSNQTLEQLVRVRPRSPQALAGIKGLGPSRLERHGAALLAAIAQAGPAPSAPVPPLDAEVLSLLPLTQTTTVAPRAPEPAPSKSAAPQRLLGPAPYVATEEWTCRLLERGFSVEDAAAIRGLDTSAIVRHLTLAARQGRRIAVETFLDPATIQLWDEWRSENGDVTPPDGLFGPAALWELFLVCRAH